MTSREEFMRSLGISASDMSKPPAEDPTKARRKPPLGASAAAEISSPVREAPQAPPRSSGAAPTGASAASRAEFLRSLGIDNAAEDKLTSQAPAPSATRRPAEAVSTPVSTRNATGSQELPRSSFRSTPSASSASSPTYQARPQSVPRSKYTHFAEEEEEVAPTTVPQRMPSDWTLGPKAAAHRAPPTPSLDSELKSMKDTAGAEEVKAMGNKFFQAGDYRKAVRLYTRAIELDPTNAAVYSNRSAAYLLGGKQMAIDTRSMALRDADKAIKLKPTWFKGFSRRGDALFKLERHTEAAEAYESALELDPGNSAIVHSLNEVRPYVSKAKRDASWSAPGSGNLHASVTSLTGTKTSEKSAFELMDELDIQRERTTPHLARGGDYKSKQLDDFRRRTTTSGTFEASDESPTYAPRSNTTTSDSGVRERPTVTAEFTSDAARDYQQQLLESYRKKKEAAAAARR